MKILKIRIQLDADLAQPLGNVSDEEIAKELTPEVEAKMRDEVKADLLKQYAKQGLEMRSFDVTVEVVNV